MVTMKKLMSLLMVTVLLISTFTGCGLYPEEETVTETETTDCVESVTSEDTTVCEDTEEDTARDGTVAEDTTAEEENTTEEGSTAEEETTPQALYTVEGNKVYFGSYPQTEETDPALIAILNREAGPLPTSYDFESWMPYGYYLEGEVCDYMWYIDLEYQGSMYRGVYFTAYRPDFTTEASPDVEYSKQAERGYYTGTVYWFKYEPIAWTILERGSNGKVLLLCDLIIDSQEFCLTNSGTRTIDGKTVYPNNYEYSHIREWLNSTFYETAFSNLQQEMILTTLVDNSAASTQDIPNAYACNDTRDRIFLLSYADAVNSRYGFSSDEQNYDQARQKKTTAYAQAMGAAIGGDQSDYPGCGPWRLRSPDYVTFRPEAAQICNKVMSVMTGGEVHDFFNLNYTGVGIVPAIRIQLSK